jgi:hypothetical protein
VITSLACEFYVWVEVTDSDEHTSTCIGESITTKKRFMIHAM